MVVVRADSRVRSLVMDEQCCCFLRCENGGRINHNHPSRRSLWLCVCVCGRVKDRVEGQTIAGLLAPQKHYVWANLELCLLPSSVGVLEELSEKH